MAASEGVRVFRGSSLSRSMWMKVGCIGCYWWWEASLSYVPGAPEALIEFILFRLFKLAVVRSMSASSSSRIGSISRRRRWCCSINSMISSSRDSSKVRAGSVSLPSLPLPLRTVGDMPIEYDCSLLSPVLVVLTDMETGAPLLAFLAPAPWIESFCCLLVYMEIIMFLYRDTELGAPSRSFFSCRTLLFRVDLAGSIFPAGFNMWPDYRWLGCGISEWGSSICNSISSSITSIFGGVHTFLEVCLWLERPCPCWDPIWAWLIFYVCVLLWPVEPLWVLCLRKWEDIFLYYLF